MSDLMVEDKPSAMPLDSPFRIKLYPAFSGLFILLFVGSIIPLLVLIGLLVFRLQQAYLLTEAQGRLVDFVQAGVEQYAGANDLTPLSAHLSDDFRVLGGDLVIENAGGEAVSPALGQAPWLSTWEHEAARNTRQSRMEMVGSGPLARVVYLAAVVDPTGNVIGSVEASLPVQAITIQLDTLRRQITLIIAFAAGLSGLLAVFLSMLITRPIRSLIEAMESIQEGDLKARAPLPVIQELRRLVLAYNRMLDWMTVDVREQVRRAERVNRDPKT